MKLVVAALLLAGAAVAAAEQVTLGEVRQNLFATCFPTNQQGWMVGELGRIFRTTDGGATWERQDARTKRPFLAMSCLDPKTAWIAGKEGIVYATKDGGTTWNELKTGSNRHLFALEFPTLLRGHGAGDFGTMVHTEDGGATWTTARVPDDVKLPESALDTGVEPGDVNLYSMSYGDPNHAWLAGEFGIIMASTDGGLTWKQQQTPVESTLFGIRFLDDKRGWAVGVDSVILDTEDGGATWRLSHAPIAARSLYDVFIRGDRGWIVGDSGTVLQSGDRGATWQASPLPIQLAANWIRAIALTPDASGFAVGSEGLVMRIDGTTITRLRENVQPGKPS